MKGYYTGFQLRLKIFLRRTQLKDIKTDLQDSNLPIIVPRPEHRISRSQISPHALKVLYRLKQSGHQAYLVGGGVRDLLLGQEPKDFDIATDATPEQVRGVFRNCRLIGRRFRLAHVFFGADIVEVATFRGRPELNPSGDHHTENGMIVRDNVYGTIAEDALRRDFTINALYYNIDDFSLVDYTGGLTDIAAKQLRLIGDDPVARYREDPVRMLRAVRFAAKLGFEIEDRCERPLYDFGSLLDEVSPARLFEEVLKLFHSGCAVAAFEKLRHYGLFATLFPHTEHCLQQGADTIALKLIERALDNTDQRIRNNKPIVPFFLFSVLLWAPVYQRYQALLADKVSSHDAMIQASSELIRLQSCQIVVPKRHVLLMREVWDLQPHLERRRGRRPLALIAHPRFRAAYDFLLLRAEAGEIDSYLAVWWTQFQQGNTAKRVAMMDIIKGYRTRKKRYRRPKKNKKVKEDSE